jgi:polyhydroxyalkanoate synthesis repressor PhaR
MDRKPLIIKKYENRRLYDTSNSRYVNLDEVAQMVQQGREVQVLDAATGEDLTRLVLTQIIVEQAKAPGSAFPLDVLRQMVAATGRASQEAAMSYMKAVFDMYQNAYRSMPNPLNPFGLMQPAGARPPDIDVPPPPAPGEGPRRAGPGREDEADVGELRRRLEELESRVASRRSRAKRARKPRPGTRRRS